MIKTDEKTNTGCAKIVDVWCIEIGLNHTKIGQNVEERIAGRTDIMPAKQQKHKNTTENERIFTKRKTGRRGFLYSL